MQDLRGSRQLDWGKRLILLACVAVTYGSQFWPGPLRYGLDVLGHPDYHGFQGVFLPHLLLYSTLPALIAAVLWFVLVKAGTLPPPRFANIGQSLKYGMIAGLIAIAATLLLVWVAFPAGSIGWINPDPWKIAGNLFSNFYEEFLFRGFILVALTAVFGFWPAAVLSSVMWAATHTQYPLSLQAMIALTGLLFAFIAMRCKSLLAPYVGHTVIDVIGDSLIG